MSLPCPRTVTMAASYDKLNEPGPQRQLHLLFLCRCSDFLALYSHILQLLFLRLRRRPARCRWFHHHCPSSLGSLPLTAPTLHHALRAVQFPAAPQTGHIPLNLDPPPSGKYFSLPLACCPLQSALPTSHPQAIHLPRAHTCPTTPTQLVVKRPF